MIQTLIPQQVLRCVEFLQTKGKSEKSMKAEAEASINEP